MASYGIVKTTDFVGDLYIQKEICDDQLQAYIDKYEDYYLYNLLGLTVANELIADLVDGVPQDPAILEWFNPFQVQGECDKMVYISEGIVKMLSYLIYFEFIKGEEYFVSNSGLVRQTSENSEEKDSVVTQNWVQVKAWNPSVDTWRALNEKLCLDVNEHKKMFL